MIRALFCVLVSSVLSVGYAADFSGVVVGVDGLSRSGATVNPSGGSIWRGEESDRQGRFVLKDIDKKGKVWFVYSHHSKAMGIFSIPEDYKGQEVKVVLDCRAGEVEGRVVDKDGKGLRGKKVEVVVESAKGETIVFPAHRATDKYGLYRANMPFGDGVKIHARIAGETQEEKKYITKKMTLSYGHIYKYLPTIVIGGGNPVESDDGHRHCSGRILNKKQQPIQGVEVDLSYEMPGSMGIWSKELMTDKDGRWSVRIPNAGSLRSARLSHPEYQSYHFEHGARVPSLEELKNGTNIMVMELGVRVKGIVVDEHGIPVVNAVVLAGRMYSSSGGKIIEDGTTSRTLADGSFSIGGLPQKELEMTVVADGFAPAQIKVQVAKETIPVSIKLSKGWVYKGRLVTKDGEPLEGFKVYTSGWTIGKDRKRIDRNDVTDSDGKFSVDGLPVEGTLRFTYGRSRTPYMCFSKEVTSKQSKPDEVTVHKQVYIAGKVVDAETDDPITEFTLNNGIMDKGFGDSYTWSRYYKNRVKSADGTFNKKWNGYHISFPFDGSCHMLVTAKGYLPEVTPPVKIGQDYKPFVIRMTKGKAWAGKIVDSEGKEVKGVQVGWVAGKEKAFIKDGKFDPSGFAYQAKVIVKSKADGAFSIPPSRDKGLFVAVHPGKGYAVVESEGFKNGSSMKLTPWARIEGVNLAAGNNDQFSMRVSTVVSNEQARKQKVRWLFGNVSFSKETFAVNHLPSVPLMIGKVIRWEMSDHINLTPQPGKTHKIVLGTDGCTVTGKIVLPLLIDGKPVSKDVFGDPRQLYVVAFRADPKEKLPPEIAGKTHDDFTMLYRDIENLYEGSKTFQKRFMPTIKADGTFTIDNLPPGKYDLVVNLHSPLGDEQQCGRGFREAAMLVSFTVGKDDKTVKIPEVKVVSAFK